MYDDVLYLFSPQLTTPVQQLIPLFFWVIERDAHGVRGRYASNKSVNNDYFAWKLIIYNEKKIEVLDRVCKKVKPKVEL